MAFVNPQYLVSTEWLADHLNDPTVRIVDATVHFRGSIESGRADYEKSHIPGAVFADVITELSDQNSKYRFMMPPAEQFARVLSNLGIGSEHKIICYDQSANTWATRFWWMLRSFGHDNAAVLDGGFKKWTAEGRPVSSDPVSLPAATFNAALKPDHIATKQEVFEATTNGDVCIINALNEAQHSNREGKSFGRAGHIPSAINVPVSGLVDPNTNTFLPADELAAHFAGKATDSGRVITYCGGGIAATGDAFILTLLGHNNVAVYDGSMSEWSADPAMPMEVD